MWLTSVIALLIEYLLDPITMFLVVLISIVKKYTEIDLTGSVKLQCKNEYLAKTKITKIYKEETQLREELR